MAVVTAYDSGITTLLAADTWHRFRVGSEVSPVPFYILMVIELEKTPNPAYNLAGYCCMEYASQGRTMMGVQSAIPAIVNTPIGTGNPRYALEPVLVQNLIGSDETIRNTKFRGVAWQVNRWIGKHRARVLYLN